MSGPVEVDEVYLGEREKNKHANKRGNTKKTAVIGIKDRNTGTIVAMPVLRPLLPALNTLSNPILSRVPRCTQTRIRYTIVT